MMQIKKIKRVFRNRLLGWYRLHGRSYVWRKERDPFKLLIAEIMLQRTKADQVEPVYISFIKRFPAPKELYQASEEEIGGYFGKLGLFWRTKLVKRLACELEEKFNGIVPKSRDGLLSLPAVGEYMADAVLSFAYDENVAVVDANVCRIIGRVFDLKAKGEARRDQRFRIIAQELLPTEKAKDFNWAMIDLASTVCIPRNPKHGMCPLNKICLYYLKEAGLVKLG